MPKPTKPADRRDSEILSLTRQVKSLKTTVRNLKDREKAAIAEIEDWERRVDFADQLRDRQQPSALKRVKQSRSGRATAIAVMTDWHAEEKIDPDVNNGLNSYDLAICKRRGRAAFRKVLELIDWYRQFARVDDLVLAFLGDFITGYIHEELLEGNALSPTEASLFVQDRLAEGIQMLLDESDLKRIIIPTCHGNHGRTTPKKRIATSYANSYEWLLYNQLARQFANEPRVRFDVGKGYHNYVDVQGRTVRFHHGDAIRYGGGVGGITIPVNKQIARWNTSRHADLDVFGHYHQFMHSWRFISCGCLCGYNAYAVEIGAEHQPPTQTFAVMSKRHGLDLAMPIYVGD